MNRWIVYAIGATVAAGGSTAAFFLPAVDLQPTTPGTQQSGHANISGTLTAGRVVANVTGPLDRAVIATSSSATGTNYTGYFTNASDTGRAVYGLNSNPTGQGFGGYFQASGSNARGIFGLTTHPTGVTYGGLFQSSSSNGRGVTAYATASSGQTTGGDFRVNSPNGVGVFGWNTSSSATAFGGEFRSDSNSGAAAYIHNTVGGTGLRVESFGTALDVLGVALFSEMVNFDKTVSFSGSTPFTVSNSNVIPLLNADKVDGKDASDFLEGIPVPLVVQGDTLGMYVVTGKATGSSSRGVFGTATGPQSTGVFGQADAAGSSGVFAQGETGLTARTFAPSGTGAFGYCYANTGLNYGVYGGTSSGSGFGVFSAGNMGASGTKPFRIDHPLDPTNKYLFHYSAESPEPQNFYNGTVRTDSHGDAWVQLPDYFEEINKDFRYTLTVVEDNDSDSFVIAKVAKKINANRFKIRTNAPNVEVSWEVKALRNDLWVQKYGAPTVREKVGKERGKYQHPELYGQPAEMGMNAIAPNQVPGESGKKPPLRQ